MEQQQHQKKSPTTGYECPVCPMSMTTTKLSSVQALRQHLKAHGSLQRVVMCCSGCERVEEKDSGTTITTAITTSITPTSTGSKGTIISPAFITPLLLYRHIRQQHGIRQETEVLEMISKSIANGIEDDDDDEDEDQGGGQGGGTDFEEAYHEAMENEAVEEARRQRANGARFRCTRCGTCGTQALLEEHSCLPRGAKSPPLQDIFVEEEEKPEVDKEDVHKLELENVKAKFKKEIRAAGVAPKETEEEEVEEEDKEVQKEEEEEDDDDDEIEVLDVPELPLPTVEQIMLPLNIRKMVKFNVDVPYVALPDPSFQHKEMHLKDNNDFHTGKHYILVPLVSLVQASD